MVKGKLTVANCEVHCIDMEELYELAQPNVISDAWAINDIRLKSIRYTDQVLTIVIPEVTQSFPFMNKRKSIVFPVCHESINSLLEEIISERHECGLDTIILLSMSDTRLNLFLESFPHTKILNFEQHKKLTWDEIPEIPELYV